MRSASIRELATAYARLGLREWKGVRPQRRNSAHAFGAFVARYEEDVRLAVEQPFDPESAVSARMWLLPIPQGHRKVPVAFFAPWVPASERPERLAFDLVVMQSRPIAFRFEPGAEGGGAHGYDHVQLSQSLGRGTLSSKRMQSPLPVTYPAFPIPTEDSVTRFLALVVAMHGYPNGTYDVLQRAFGSRANRLALYLRLTKAMLRQPD